MSPSSDTLIKHSFFINNCAKGARVQEWGWNYLKKQKPKKQRMWEKFGIIILVELNFKLYFIRGTLFIEILWGGDCQITWGKNYLNNLFYIYQQMSKE